MPELTFLSETGEPEVVAITTTETQAMVIREDNTVAVVDKEIELLTIRVQGQKGDPGVGDVENAILDGGTFN